MMEFHALQGSALTSLLVSYQRQGSLLQGIAPLQFCICIAGTPSRLEAHRSAYSQPISCPSLHLIGAACRITPQDDLLSMHDMAFCAHKLCALNAQASRPCPRNLKADSFSLVCTRR